MILPVVHRLGRILSWMLSRIIELSRRLGWILLGGRGGLGLGLQGVRVGAGGLKLLVQGGELVLGL